MALPGTPQYVNEGDSDIGERTPKRHKGNKSPEETMYVAVG